MKDQAYVVKEIDVAELPEKKGLEALSEMQMMCTMDSPYVVGYYDSFIDEQRINLVLEYCTHGDLCSLVEKQHGKLLSENAIWKIFIHICLGI